MNIEYIYTRSTLVQTTSKIFIFFPLSLLLLLDVNMFFVFSLNFRSALTNQSLLKIKSLWTWYKDDHYAHIDGIQVESPWNYYDCVRRLSSPSPSFAVIGRRQFDRTEITRWDRIRHFDYFSFDAALLLLAIDWVPLPFSSLLCLFHFRDGTIAHGMALQWRSDVFVSVNVWLAAHIFILPFSSFGSTSHSCLCVCVRECLRSGMSLNGVFRSFSLSANDNIINNHQRIKKVQWKWQQITLGQQYVAHSHSRSNNSSTPIDDGDGDGDFWIESH